MPSLKVKVLNQKHPEWDNELWSLLGKLYVGGFEVSSDAELLNRMLPMHVNESSSLHADRKRSASYINYMSDVIDFYGSHMFAKTLVIEPDKKPSDIATYEEFGEDADGMGHTFQRLMADSFITAATLGKTLVGVDFPRVEPGMEPQNLEEQVERGLDRPRAFAIHPSSMFDWKKADDGSFEWAILYRKMKKRGSPLEMRDTVIEQWKIWSMSPDGFAQWQLFESTRKEKDPELNDTAEVLMVGEDVTTFKRVPIIEMQLPTGLWIGNKIGPMVLEHFRRRTMLVASQRKSLMAIPVLKLGPEIGVARGAQPSEAQQSPHRGNDPKGQFDSKGYVRIGADDSLEFAEPIGGAYKIEAEQLDRLVDEIFRVSHLMAQSVAATSQALSRSGMSKAEDRNSTEVVLEAFGDMVGKFAVRIYDVIAEARKDDVFWTAEGLSDFSMRNREQVVDEGTKVSSIAIPSKTFRSRYFNQVAMRLLDEVSPEDEKAIRDEIEVASVEEPKPIDDNPSNGTDPTQAAKPDDKTNTKERAN